MKKKVENKIATRVSWEFWRGLRKCNFFFFARKIKSAFKQKDLDDFDGVGADIAKTSKRCFHASD